MYYLTTDAQLGGGGGGRPLLSFFENQKKRPNSKKKCPDCVLPWVKFSIQNVVWRVSRRKNAKVFFLDFLTCLSKCPNSKRPPLPGKVSDWAPGQGVHLLEELINKLLKWNLSQAFLKALTSSFIYLFISTLLRRLQIYSSGPGTSLIQAWQK